MAAPTPQEATAAASCFDCIPQNMRLPVLIYLFRENAGMSDTPQQLVEAARCFQCIPENMQMPVLLYLAANGGTGGGGGGGVESGPVDPVAPPTGTSAFYYNTTDFSFWAWNSVNATWEKIIG